VEIVMAFRNWWTRLVQSRTPSRPARRRRGPHLESLEDRTVPAVQAVSSASLSSVTDDLGEAPQGLSGGYTIAALAVVYALGIVAEGVSRLLFEWRLAQLSVKLFPGEQRPVEERERQRLSVVDRSDKLADAINAQLKRLRIERTLALSSAIATVAFAIRTDWGWCLGMLLLTCVAIRLVEERFNRYIKTIQASYRALPPLEPASEGPE
jgi:hypothetical protein